MRAERKRRGELVAVFVVLAAGGVVAAATGALAAEEEPPPVIGAIGGDAVAADGVGADGVAADGVAADGVAGDGASGDGAVAPSTPALTPEELESCGSALERCEMALIQAGAELELANTAAARAGAPGGVPPAIGPIAAGAGGAAGAAGAGGAGVDRSPSTDELGGRDEVAAVVKNMKPKDAAEVVALWDEGLAADVMARLPARVSAPVFGAMPPPTAAKITARIAGMRLGREPKP